MISKRSFLAIALLIVPKVSLSENVDVNNLAYGRCQRKNLLNQNLQGADLRFNDFTGENAPYVSVTTNIEGACVVATLGFNKAFKNATGTALKTFDECKKAGFKFTDGQTEYLLELEDRRREDDFVERAHEKLGIVNNGLFSDEAFEIRTAYRTYNKQWSSTLNPLKHLQAKWNLHKRLQQIKKETLSAHTNK